LNNVYPALWIAGFMTGVMGSGHCFAMCGGIAGGFGALSAKLGAYRAIPAAMQFHLGRLLSYAMLGALTAGLIGVLGHIPQMQSMGRWLRLATAVMVALIGLRFLFNWRGLDFIEQRGGLVWKRISPWMMRAGARPDGAGRLLLGLGWGLLPCGLVYTMLLTAGSTGNVLAGSTTMLAFGVGTLPAMLGLTLLAPGLSALLADRVFRAFVGFGLIVLSLWMAFTLVVHAGHGVAHH
jgi:sulfite exporter TauE/SafE